MDIRSLRHFVAVADARSFTGAAVELRLSQPALSQSIQRLEKEIGTLLVVRDRRPGAGAFELTPAGSSLYSDAVAIIAATERARQRASRAGATSSAVRLDLGFASTTPGRLTGEALRLADAMPGLEVVPVHLTWGDEHQRLLYGDVDLAFMAYPAGTEFPAYDVLPMSSHARGALFPSGHPLAKRAELILDDLRDEPILDPGFARDPNMHRDFWLASPRPGHPMPPVIGPPARAVEEMCAFVAAGKGMAIVSSVMPEQYATPGVTFVPIRDLGPVEVGLVRLRDDTRRHVVEYAERMREVAALGPQRNLG